MDKVDDATSETQARLKEETIWAAADVLRAWMGNVACPALTLRPNRRASLQCAFQRNTTLQKGTLLKS